MKFSPLSSGTGRPSIIGSRPGFGKSALAGVGLGGGATGADPDLLDASDSLDNMANGLAVDADLLRLALLGLVEGYATKTRDGDVVKFENTSTTGTEVKTVTLVSSAAVTLRCMSTSAGWFVPFVAFDVDGGGDNDVATAILTVSGHDPTPERHLIRSGKGLDFGFGRVLNGSTLFTIEAPQASATSPVTVFISANGDYPTSEKLEAIAGSMAPALPRRQRDAGKRKRARRGASGGGMVGGKPGWMTSTGK